MILEFLFKARKGNPRFPSSRLGRHRLKHQKLVFGIGFHASLCSF